jgi:hypothetical protein
MPLSLTLGNLIKAACSMEGSSSVGMESLASNMKELLKSLEPPLSPECCIYRVPNNIRKWNEEAYTPQVISIGPLHHGDKRLKNMEKIKVRYFKRFVEKAKLEVEDLVSIIRVGKEMFVVVMQRLVDLQVIIM